MLTNQKLYDKIMSFQIDLDDSVLPFSTRLVNENLGWTKNYALKCIEEYKKFIYLICVKGACTPSQDVDEVWHLHMIYTDSYKELCKLIGKEISHNPTKGGQSENDKFDWLYKTTLANYMLEFDQVAPEDIWEPPTLRFSRNKYLKVNIDNYYVIHNMDYEMCFILFFKTILNCFSKYFSKFHLWPYF